MPQPRRPKHRRKDSKGQDTRHRQSRQDAKLAKACFEEFNLLSLGRNARHDSTTHLIRRRVLHHRPSNTGPRWLRDSFGLPPATMEGEPWLLFSEILTTSIAQPLLC
jgi:hypothetical protein